MKIMLQGYLADANFGDMLYAHLFYRKCLSLGFDEVGFFQYKGFGIGPHCRKELGYTENKSLLSCFFSDAFVLISCGCLWNSSVNPHDAKERYFRFVFPARVYELLGKPVYVLGCGGGEVETKWLRRRMVRMLSGAKTVLFRDTATRKCFENYRVKNTPRTTADTVLAITPDMIPEFEEKQALTMAADGRKKLLLHIPDGVEANRDMAEKVLPALVRFLAEHSEYLVVVSHDNIRPIGKEEAEQIRRIYQALDGASVAHYDYRYHDSMQMCALIGETDCIVTAKLHVGVVGCALGKSVVPFPFHREKTDNFYAEIGESDRCRNMRILTDDVVFRQLSLYHDKPVVIPQGIRKKAAENLDALAHILQNPKKEA